MGNKMVPTFTNYCDVCGNVMNVFLEDNETRLCASCPRCTPMHDTTKVLVDNQSLCMSVTCREVQKMLDNNESVVTLSQTASEIMRNDATIPRISDVKCPKGCLQHQQLSECMYITSHAGTNTYVCCTCFACFRSTATVEPLKKEEGYPGNKP